MNQTADNTQATQAPDYAASKGKFRAYLNRKKMPGDRQPGFHGNLNLPNTTAERPVALWVSESQNSGEIVISGRAGESANDQIANLTAPPNNRDPDRALAILNRDGTTGLELDPHQVMLFKNKSKDSANAGRPDYYGYYNPGAQEQLQRLAIWSELDRNGNVKLTGYVEAYDPERALSMKDERPPMDDDMAPDGQVPQQPERSRGRAREPARSR